MARAMRLRQIALVAKDMAPVQSALFDMLGVDSAYIAEAIKRFGLQNIVITVGDTFLEVVSPIEEGTTAGRLLQRRGGDGRAHRRRAVCLHRPGVLPSVPQRGARSVPAVRQPVVPASPTRELMAPTASGVFGARTLAWR